MAEDTAAVDALRKGLAAKDKETEALSIEIERTRLETQILRLSLQIQGVEDGSVIPAGIRSGGNVEDPTRKFTEHKRLLEWLAEVCDMKSRRTCNVLGDIYVAETKAVIGSAVQWSLSVQNDLNLTIPKMLESTLISMLSKARRSVLSPEDLECFGSEWDMLSVEMTVEGERMPGLFLIRHEDCASIVVSAWPKLPPLADSSASCHNFDPAEFFSRTSNETPCMTKVVFLDSDSLANAISFGTNGTVQWHRASSGWQDITEIGINFRMCDHTCEPPEFERFSLTGPFGRVVIADPPAGNAQRELVAEIVSLSLKNEIRVYHAKLSSVAAAGEVSKGDSVEVQHEGEWLAGVLQEVKSDFAFVRCDADHPDVIIVAPLRQVRAASCHKSEEQHSMNNSVSQ